MSGLALAPALCPGQDKRRTPTTKTRIRRNCTHIMRLQLEGAFSKVMGTVLGSRGNGNRNGNAPSEYPRLTCKDTCCSCVAAQKRVYIFGLEKRWISLETCRQKNFWRGCNAAGTALTRVTHFSTVSSKKRKNIYWKLQVQFYLNCLYNRFKLNFQQQNSWR